jgi:hypothetical protein
MSRLLRLVRDQRRRLQGLDEPIYICCWQRPNAFRPLVADGNNRT